jgi:hypothetical protein
MKTLTENKDVYTRNGFENRGAYLDSLAEDYGVDPFVIHMVADMIGPSEDFDGLVSELEDMYVSGALDVFRKQEVCNG